MARLMMVLALVMTVGIVKADGVSLNGNWEFAFKEGKTLEEVGDAGFGATDSMAVPGCWDVCPKWYLKRGTGLYRRSFTLERAMKDAVLVVEGMGIRARFEVDGRDLGVSPYTYAKLELPLGALTAGEHTIFAAVDNVMDWPRVKLARSYYDFYFYGGFYHGVRIEEREQKVFVKTVDWKTKRIAVKVGDGAWEERTLADAKLWSPEEPNLTTIEVAGRKVRFGLRQVEAKNCKIYLNGKELFLKGFNRHESSMLEGSATSGTTMVRDLQHLKELGGNFIRGAHYQQCEQFLDLCDEMGVLVWEESLGWQNGVKWFDIDDIVDEEFCEMQVTQTRNMVRESFNHPSVIIYGFLNEPGGDRKETKALIDRLISTIRKEDTGRLVTFACNGPDKDISNENTDLISINSYPGTIPMKPGTPEALAKKVRDDFNRKIALMRSRYPEKPIMVSESGCGAVRGMRMGAPSTASEEFQEEYLRDILETLWANKDCIGFSIWQMNDGRTRERFEERFCSAWFGGSIAGCFDGMRMPKMSTETIKKFFAQK